MGCVGILTVYVRDCIVEIAARRCRHERLGLSLKGKCNTALIKLTALQACHAHVAQGSHLPTQCKAIGISLLFGIPDARVLSLALPQMLWPPVPALMILLHHNAAGMRFMVFAGRSS